MAEHARPANRVEGDDTMHNHRSTDTFVGGTIKREVPIWSLITMIGFVAAQALGMYVEQREQRSALSSVASTQADINRQLTELAKELGNKNLKDIEHDLKIDDLRRRVTLLEDVRSDGPARNGGHKP